MNYLEAEYDREMEVQEPHSALVAQESKLIERSDTDTTNYDMSFIDEIWEEAGEGDPSKEMRSTMRKTKGSMFYEQPAGAWEKEAQ